MYTQFLSSAPLFQYQYDIVTTLKYFLLLTALHVYTSYFSTGVLEKKEKKTLLYSVTSRSFILSVRIQHKYKLDIKELSTHKIQDF